jgi:hypothetical protein
MAVIEQSNFALGQVDKIYFTDTMQQQYLEALSLCENAYITGQRVPSRRKSFGFIDTENKYPTTTNSKEFINFEFESTKGSWYEVLLTWETDRTRATLVKFAFNNNTNIYEPDGFYMLPEVAGSEFVGVRPNEIDYSATDNYIVLVNENVPPQKITIDETTLSSSGLENIAFNVAPALDFGDLDYSDYTFTPKCTGGGSPSGTPPVCPVGEVFGGVIDVTRVNASDPEFTSDWVGGLIIGQTGASTQQPIGIGLITGISTVSSTVQRLTVTVLQAFGTENFSTAGQTWSVRKPAWGATQGYPAKTTFHKGRLWFANIKAYPMFIAGSRTNTPNDFNVGNGEAPDAIAYILQNSEGGGIQNIFGGQNLHIFTPTQQLAVVGGIDVGIEPANFSPKLISQFTSSSIKPTLYRDRIYLTTADGNALIEIQEVDREVAAGIVSFSATELIKNPIKIVAHTLVDTEDQILSLLNEDGTITIFSKSVFMGVQAFTPSEISLFQNEKVLGLGVINNVLYAITDKLRIIYSSNGKNFDAWKNVSMTNGVITLGFYPSAQVGDLLGVTYETNINGQINNNYLGEFPIIDVGGLKVDVGQNITATATVGLNYTTKIRSMPLYSSPTGSFKLKKVSNAWLQFSNSFNFKFNGRRLGINLPATLLPSGANPQSLTGTSQIGVAQGYKQDFFLEVIQDTPYDLTVQTFAWSITEALIE